MVTNDRLLRNFVLTHNNYTQEDIEFWKKFECQYIIIGKETAKTTGTPHLQGYVELLKRTTFSSVIKQIPRGVHIEPRRGSQKNAIDYSKKDGDFFEVGEPKRQGSRSDYDLAKYLLSNSVSISTAMEEYDDFTIGTLNAYEKLQKYIEVGGSRVKPCVTWIYGPGGSGKTERAYNLAGNSVYKVDLLDKGWFDGYDRHKTVIIDDFCCDEDNAQLFKTILAITDRYPLRVNVKGCTVWFTPEQVIFTSQSPPWKIWPPDQTRYNDKPGPDMFSRGVKLRQIMRRITRVEYLDKASDDLSYPVLINLPEEA